MIEGIKIELDSHELRQTLERRAAHHKERAAWYGEQVATLCAGGAQTEHRSMDPVSSLRQRGKEHTQTAALLTFVAQHVIPGEVYRLTQADLSRFELVEGLEEF